MTRSEFRQESNDERIRGRCKNDVLQVGEDMLSGKSFEMHFSMRAPPKPNTGSLGRPILAQPFYLHKRAFFDLHAAVLGKIAPSSLTHLANTDNIPIRVSLSDVDTRWGVV